MRFGYNIGYWRQGPPAGALEAVREAERLGFDSVWTSEAYGSDGSLFMDGDLMRSDQMQIMSGAIGQDAAVEMASSDRKPASGAEPPARRAAGAIVSLALMLDDWLPAFDGQPTVAASLADGHRVARVIDAARRSSDGGGWVTL